MGIKKESMVKLGVHTLQNTMKKRTPGFETDYKDVFSFKVVEKTSIIGKVNTVLNKDMLVSNSSFQQQTK